MTIRKAAERDVPAIVELLKLSLGEDLLPKSEAFWNWKHTSNPFGESPVLVQEDAGKIVGVRAFMQWRWIKEGKIYKALRAVDTATHPEYQGKGIFKKLTLGLVDESIKGGYDFIYNTPNGSSMPGYLKMGWQTLGKPLIRIRPSIAMVLTRVGILNRVLDVQKFINYSTDSAFNDSEALVKLVSKKKNADQAFLKTDISVDYLKWRYNTIPIHTYGCLHDLNSKASYCIFFRPKQTRFGIEGRITDVLIDVDTFSKLEFKRNFQTLAKNFDFLSIASADPQLKTLLNELFFLPALKAGPVVTTRNLNLENPEFLLNFTPWKPTLGDLELF
jgi:N-acetylglutamate synthase-like GNAT family acetyltransferase